MSALITKSFEYVYKTLKFYLGLALVGALTVIVISTFFQYPWVFKLSIVVAIWWGIYKTIVKDTWFNSGHPPITAQRLIRWLAPHDQNEYLGDLYEAYWRRSSSESNFVISLVANLWFWKETIYLARIFVKWRIRNLSENQQDNEFKSIMSYYRKA